MGRVTTAATVQADDRGGAAQTFLITAREIVSAARGRLLSDLEADPAKALKKLSREELEKIALVMVGHFIERQMGLKALQAAARRELSICAIRHCVDRYSESLMAGHIDPLEYFERFYLKLFLTCGLPAQAICVVDPNLHRVAKKLGEYPKLTQAVTQGVTASVTPR